jgi:hypothetical protein
MQLALDYSPEEDGLTLASLPASFFGGLRKPDPLLGHVSFAANRLVCLLTGSSACLRNLRASSSGMAFCGSTGRSQEQQNVNKLETLGDVIRPYFPRQAVRRRRFD